MGQVERNKRTTWLQFFWFVSDVVAILVGFTLGYVIRFHSPFAVWVPPVTAVPAFDLYLFAAGVTVVIWVPLFYALGLYRIERGKARHRRGDLLRGLLLGALILAAVGFFYRGASFSRVGMVLTWSVTSVLVLSGRTLVYRARRRLAPLAPIRFAVVGSGPMVGRVVESLARSSYPHECAGLLVGPTGAEVATAEPAIHGSRTVGFGTVAEARPAPDQAHIVETPRGARLSLAVLGTVDRLEDVARAHRLDLVVMTASAGRAEELEAVYTRCQRIDLDFQFVPEVFSLWGRPVHVEDVDGLPLLRLRELPLSGWNGVVKRGLDLVVSGPLLLLLAPLFAVLAVAVKVSSPGPVFHRQTRVGRDRRPFSMIKFRSMRMDAERESGPVWASRNDPRRTAVGAFLRKWSLDELPQLWNVFKGEMSLVGPRPERPVFVEEFESRVQDYYDRHRVKSGVTGWAQVHGLRGNVPIEQRTAHDLYYVENWSLWLDLRILWLTVWAVFAHRGE